MNIEVEIKNTYRDHLNNFYVRNAILEGFQTTLIVDKTTSLVKVACLAFDEKTKSFKSFNFETLNDDFRTIKNVDLRSELQKADDNSMSAKEAIDLFEAESRSLAKLSTNAFIDKLKLKVPLASITEKLNVDALHRREIERLTKLNTVWSKYNDEFNKEALEAVRDTNFPFTWKHLGFYSSSREELLPNRLQSIKIFPMLTGFIAEKIAFTTRKIDRSKNPDGSSISLNKELAAHFKTTEKYIKKINSKKWNTHDIPLTTLFKYLSELPIDRFPNDETQWNAFCMLSKHVRGHIGRHMEHIIENPSQALYKGMKGSDWVGLVNLLAKEYRDTRPPQGTPDEVAEVLKDIGKNSIFPFKKIRENLKSGMSEGELKEHISIELGKMDWADVKSKLPENALTDDAAFNHFVSSVLPRTKDIYVDWLYEIVQPDTSETFFKNMKRDFDYMLYFTKDKVVVPATAHAIMDYSTLQAPKFGPQQQAEMLLAAVKLLFTPNDKSCKNASQIMSVVRKFTNELSSIVGNIVGTEEIRKREIMADIPPNGWVKIFDGKFITRNNYGCEVLNTEEQLKEEGSVLRHCVGDGGVYVQHCQKLGNSIISVTTPEGEKIATAELGPISRNNAVTLKQFYAINDTQPDNETRAALQDMIDAIENGTLAINHDDIDDYFTVNGKKEPIEVGCWYEWRNKSNIQNAMNNIGAYIHKKVISEDKVRTIDDLCRHSSILEAAESLVPKLKKRVQDRNQESAPSLTM